jgi:diaminopimelate dehydrogenase
MRRLRLALVGWGRLGNACAQAVRDVAELALAGIVRRADSLAADAGSPVPGVSCVSHVSELEAVDVALLCVPAGVAPGVARELLQARVPLVECADLGDEASRTHHDEIARLAQRHRVGAVIGAGWDPGLLPQLQRLFELLIPKGHTQTSRHVGARLHHTAAAEGIAGVRGALCSELHDADHHAQRYVYVELSRDGDLERVRRQIAGDPLFADEPTQVLPVEDLAALEQENRGVLVERLGEGAGGPHASLILEARLDPVAFTARLMLDAARLLPPHARGAWRYTPCGIVPLDSPGARAGVAGARHGPAAAGSGA